MLCFTVLFSSYFSFKNEVKAYADGFALAITSGMFAAEGGAGAALTATLSVAAPYALALVAAGLAAGIVYKNRAQIYGFACGAMEHLNKLGKGIGEGIKSAADGTVYLTGVAKAELLNYMNGLNKSIYQFKSFVRNVAVPAGQTVWTNFKLLLTPNMSFYWQSLSEIYNTRIVFKTDDGTILRGSRMITVPRGVTYGNGYYWGDNSSLSNNYTGQSVSVGFLNEGNNDSIVSLDQVVDYNAGSICPSTSNTYGVDTPFANSVDATKVISQSTGVSTWDDVVGKTWSDVIGNTDAVGNVSEKEMEGDIADSGTITDDIAVTLDDAIANELVDEIEGSWDNPFKKSLKSIEEMDTSQGAPPKIYFNLHKLFGAAISRFDVSNPFPDKDTVLIDFEMINNYKFNGVPLIGFFRGIVGFGFIYMTLLYCLRKFTPDSVI